jgi:hypothetical protein
VVGVGAETDVCLSCACFLMAGQRTAAKEHGESVSQRDMHAYACCCSHGVAWLVSIDRPTAGAEHGADGPQLDEPAPEEAPDGRRAHRRPALAPGDPTPPH